MTGAEDVYSFSTALSALAVAGEWQLAVGLVEGMLQACSLRSSIDASRGVLPREQDREDLLGPPLGSDLGFPSWDQLGAKRVQVEPK